MLLRLFFFTLFLNLKFPPLCGRRLDSALCESSGFVGTKMARLRRKVDRAVTETGLESAPFGRD